MLTRRNAVLAASATLVASCADRPATADKTPTYGVGLKPLPFPVQEIYPAAHKGRIHIAGGLLAQDGRVTSVSDRHIAYDPKTQATATLTSLPAPRHHPHAIDHNGRLFLLGGFGTNPGAVNWIMSTDTLHYDDASDRWTALAPSPEPHAEFVATSLASISLAAAGQREQRTSPMVITRMSLVISCTTPPPTHGPTPHPPCPHAIARRGASSTAFGTSSAGAAWRMAQLTLTKSMPRKKIAGAPPLRCPKAPALAATQPAFSAVCSTFSAASISTMAAAFTPKPGVTTRKPTHGHPHLPCRPHAMALGQL